MEVEEEAPERTEKNHDGGGGGVDDGGEKEIKIHHETTTQPAEHKTQQQIQLPVETRKRIKVASIRSASSQLLKSLGAQAGAHIFHISKSNPNVSLNTEPAPSNKKGPHHLVPLLADHGQGQEEGEQQKNPSGWGQRAHKSEVLHLARRRKKLKYSELLGDEAHNLHNDEGEGEEMEVFAPKSKEVKSDDDGCGVSAGEKWPYTIDDDPDCKFEANAQRETAIFDAELNPATIVEAAETARGNTTAAEEQIKMESSFQYDHEEKALLCPLTKALLVFISYSILIILITLVAFRENWGKTTRLHF